MNIYRAIKKAWRKNKCIAIKGIPVKIKPTNTSKNCVVITEDGKESMHGWQPDASDLLRKDWEVVD